MNANDIKLVFENKKLREKLSNTDIQLKNARRQVNARIIKESAELDKKYRDKIKRLEKRNCT